MFIVSDLISVCYENLAVLQYRSCDSTIQIIAQLILGEMQRVAFSLYLSLARSRVFVCPCVRVSVCMSRLWTT